MPPTRSRRAKCPPPLPPRSPPKRFAACSLQRSQSCCCSLLTTRQVRDRGQQRQLGHISAYRPLRRLSHGEHSRAHGASIRAAISRCDDSMPRVFAAAAASHRAQVRVINKSDKKQRIHVLPPQTPSFKFDVTNNGFIRPGLAQEIKITFRPSEYRYYYDCIRLHCPSQNILVRCRLSNLPPLRRTPLFPGERRRPPLLRSAAVPGTYTRLPRRGEHQLRARTRLWHGAHRTGAREDTVLLLRCPDSIRVRAHAPRRRSIAGLS
jgi:hypothetical protein